VAERKIASIVWRQFDPNEIEIVYGDGTVEHVDGTHADAVARAESAGMRMVTSPLGTVRWTQDLPQKGGRAPKRIGPWLTM
jgi:hypothetical protein